MPRPIDPDVRIRLVEVAAEMLARREPVTARALAQHTGTSTTALYTHFGGMPGLWQAVRHEGFVRMARHLAAVPRGDDPVCELAALGAAYHASARAEPFLYRAMFDASADLVDPAAAADGFRLLVDAADRARSAGRFGPSADTGAVATRYWAAGHGLAMLVLTGVLPEEDLAPHAKELAIALFVAAGDAPGRCRASVERGWADGARRGAGDH